MIRGLYTATAGMLTQQRKHDVATQNLSNMNTVGFKEGVAAQRAFPEMLMMLRGSENKDGRIGYMNSGVMMEETMLSFVQGPLQQTGRATDAALLSNISVTEEVDGQQRLIMFDGSGKGLNAAGEVVYQPQAMFTVETPAGERRYTRNGEFFVNGTGSLLTTTGARVLDQDGEAIVLGVPMDEVSISERGQLYHGATGTALLNAAGQPIQLLLSQINDPHQLIREGDHLFRLDTPTDDLVEPVVDLNQINVQQGFVERANVDPIVSQTNMMAAVRAYEANQRVVQIIDQTLDKAVNEIGRL